MRTPAFFRFMVPLVLATGVEISIRAVTSIDRKTWKPVTTQRSSFDFDVPLPAGASAVYFATFYPYTYSQFQQHNRPMVLTKYATTRLLGKTVHGREIRMFAITDPQVPSSTKRRAFLIGGTHGAENASMYGVEGMLDFLVSEDSLAREMRRQVIWEIVPV